MDVLRRAQNSKKNLPLSIRLYSVASNFKWKIFSNFVPFSEGSNFKKNLLEHFLSLLTCNLTCKKIGIFVNYWALGFLLAVKVMCLPCTNQSYTSKVCTVRPRDTRPQAARTSTMHDFELGPKFFEMHVFGHFSFSCTILEDFSQFLHDFAQFWTILHYFKVSNWASIFISVFKAEAITIRWNPFWRYIHIFIQLCFHKIFMIRQRTVYKMKKNLVKAEVHRSRKTEIISPHSTLWLYSSYISKDFRAIF